MQAFQIVLPNGTPEGRVVLFREHGATDMERIYANAGLTGDEHGGHAMHKMATAGLQLSIFEVDGKPRTFETNRAEWSTLFSGREVLILTRAWTKLYYGEEGNVPAVPVTIAS